MLHQHVAKVEIAGRIAIIPDWLHKRGWQITRSKTGDRSSGRGYMQYTGRGRALTRGTMAHRAVIQRLIRDTPLERTIGPLFEKGIDLTKWHVSHMDFDKLNNGPGNFIISPPCFNPSPAKHCPFTGRAISISEWMEIMGLEPAMEKDNEVPF